MSDSDLESRASIHLSALHISGSADMALCASRPYDNKTDVADLFSMSRENVFVYLVYVGLSSSPDCPQTLSFEFLAVSQGAFAIARFSGYSSLSIHNSRQALTRFPC